MAKSIRTLRSKACLVKKPTYGNNFFRLNRLQPLKIMENKLRLAVLRDLFYSGVLAVKILRLKLHTYY